MKSNAIIIITYSCYHSCHHSVTDARFDIDGDHVLNFMELKFMMEKLDAPQTHIQLKNMLKALGVKSDGIDFTEVRICTS